MGKCSPIVWIRPLVSVAILTGCGDALGPKDGICQTPPLQKPGDWRACIHRRAYQLASSPGSAKQVADAVLIACADAVSRRMSDVPAGERDRALEEINSAAPGEARRRVEEARAGRCAAP
jgi:hypothetical protein